MEKFPDCVDLKILHFGLTCGERVRIMIKLLNLPFPNLSFWDEWQFTTFFKKYLKEEFQIYLHLLKRKKTLVSFQSDWTQTF